MLTAELAQNDHYFKDDIVKCLSLKGGLCSVSKFTELYSQGPSEQHIVPAKYLCK